MTEQENNAARSIAEAFGALGKSCELAVSGILQLDKALGLLCQDWYCMNSQGEILPIQSLDELASCNDGEWRSWWKIGYTEVCGISLRGHVLLRPIVISTVFLGLDHGWPRNPDSPLVFETMIFGGQFDANQARYRTIEQARIGHELAVFGARLARFVGPRLAMRIVGYCWSNTA